jgi:hypothetical protein
MIMASNRGAQGGPLIRLVTGPGNDVDPRFARLGASLERMSGLEDGLARIPNTLPASLEYISSGFGYRSDPFTGGAAFHAGLDFRGPIGAPIYAAAAGTVSFAGIRQGYGNCVEVSHGNGLMTRYAHMSRIGARVGKGCGRRRHRADRQHRPFHRPPPAFRSADQRPAGQSAPVSGGKTECFPGRPRRAAGQQPELAPWPAAIPRAGRSRSLARTLSSRATLPPPPTCISMAGSRAISPAPRWCRAKRA